MKGNVIIKRLLQFYDPFDALGIDREECLTIKDIRRKPIHHLNNIPTLKQHVRRINYFLKYPDKIDSIEIDGDWSILNGNPVIVDGHHRCCAAILSSKETIPSTLGGRIDIINYLLGKRKTKPRFD